MVAARIARQRIPSHCTIGRANVVTSQCKDPDGGVKVASESKESELLPTAVLPLPVVLLVSATTLYAVLELPVVLVKSAAAPVAVLSLPMVLPKSALLPMAVLNVPVVLLLSA